MHRHADPIVGLADASREYHASFKLAGNRPNIVRLAAQLPRGTPCRNYTQTRDPSQGVDQFLRDAIAEVLLVPVRAVIGEWKDGDGAASQIPFFEGVQKRAIIYLTK